MIQRAKGNNLHDEKFSHSLSEQVITSSVIKVSSHILLQTPIPFRQIKIRRSLIHQEGVTSIKTRSKSTGLGSTAVFDSRADHDTCTVQTVAVAASEETMLIKATSFS